MAFDKTGSRQTVLKNKPEQIQTSSGEERVFSIQKNGVASCKKLQVRMTIATLIKLAPKKHFSSLRKGSLRTV